MQTQQSGMRYRIAAQALIEKILADHESRPRQTLLARLFGLSPIPATEASWHIGALGERIVAKALAALPDDWHIFNSVPVGSEDADIDHLVVGPGGIFAINSKHHRGKEVWVADKTLLINGQRQSYIAVAAGEAERLTRVLASRLDRIPPARGVIAVIAPSRINIKKRPKSVEVLDARRLRRWLTKQTRVIEPHTVSAIAAVVDDPNTWRSTPVVDREQLDARFDQLMKSVDRARLVQSLWTLALALAVTGGCLAVVTHFLL